MGVYLSTPNTELEGTIDGQTPRLVFGASSMQGWRVGQEDAHIAIADYDTETSLFGVFDGHGGPEVSKYCAQHLPKFIKSLNTYQNNQLKECLEEAFLKFDKSLTEKEVIEELKILCENPEVDNEENDTDDDINEAILLREEADLPISEIMKRYNCDPIPEPESECGSSTNISAGLSLSTHIRKVSSFLRTKGIAVTPRKQQSEDTVGQSSSSKVEECSSTSSSNSAIASNSVETNEETPENIPESSDIPVPESTNEVSAEPSNGVKDTEESQTSNVSNGEISSEAEVKQPNVTNFIKEDNSDDNTPLISSADVDTNMKTPTASSYKGKGKYKKIITPKTVDSTTSDKSSEDSEKPIYQYFMEEFDEEEEESDDDSQDFEGDDESSDEEGLNDGDSDEESEESDEEQERPAPSFEKPGYDSGCTAVVALLKGNQLVVANAGDSRCVVSRNGKAIDMSVDHKPEDDIERERISKAGGKVTRDGRVNGGLNLSRAIGDHAYKQNRMVSDRDQMITALPDIRTLEIDPKTDEFLVIACDGIWNSMTSQQVIDFVAERIQKTDKLSIICDELFRTCLAPNTHGDGTGCDNMTAVIVKFVSINNLKRKIDETEDNDSDNIDSTETNDNNVVLDPNNGSQTKKTKTMETEIAVNEINSSV